MKVILKIFLFISILNMYFVNSKLNDLTHKRYYYIARLEKTINNLIKFNLKNNDYKFELQENNNIDFTNQVAIKYFDELNQSKSISSIFQFWEDIITYKYIYIEDIEKDFIKLVYTVLQKIISTNNFDLTQINKDKLDTDSLLDYIDKYNEILVTTESQKYSLLSKLINLISCKKISETNPDNINTKNITYRFYLINRLKEAEAIIKEYKNEKIIFFFECLKDNRTNLILNNNLNLSHKDIINCIKEIALEKRITPLIKIFKKFKGFHYIDDPSFVNDFLKVIFITQKSFLKDITKKEINIYKINNMTIENLLYSIDLTNQKILHTKKIDFTKKELIKFEQNLKPVTNIFKINLKLKKINQILQDNYLKPEETRNIEILDESLSDNVYKRFYLINRLQRNINSLINIKNIYLDDVSDLNINDFQNELIKSYIFNIKNSKNINPLILGWKDFLTYKFIGDDEFEQEFIMLFFYVYKNISCKLNIDKKLIDNKLTRCLSINTDDIIFRLYYLKRIEKIFWILDYSKKLKFDKNVFDINKKYFTDPKITKCIDEINSNKSLDPLIKIIEDIKHYKYIQDKNFIKEFSQLLLILSSNINNNNANINRSDFDLNSDDIETILYAIDIVAQELPKLIEKYELNSKLEWKQWLNKYWWAPPAILAILGYKILQNIKLEKINNLIKKIEHLFNRAEPEK